MPMLLGTKGADILQWRASAELVAALKEKLARRWEQSPASEAQSFLEQYLSALREESDFEAQLASALDALKEGLAEAGSPGEIVPLKARYLEAVSTHFRRRRSVLALCELCCDLHDRLLARALSFAEERMAQMGQGRAPAYALLVAGDRGRGEQTLRGENRYFLLHAEKTNRFLLFRRQLAGAMQELGLPGGDASLWHGTIRDWHAFLAPPPAQGEGLPQEDFLAALPPFASAQQAEPRESSGAEWPPVALADLVFLQGEAPLAEAALSAAARTLLEERNRDPFLQLARRVISRPLALGRFGGVRLERSGEHKGEINLKDLALDPLVQTLRVLALQQGSSSGGSVERIHLLQERGVLAVELAERLLQAYQCLMQLRVLLQIRGEEGGSYCKPEEFSTETESRFRGALEALQSLQKIAYQRLVGQA